MASSDDEEETMMESVSNYYFEDHKEEPISFSVLPIVWSENERVSGTKDQIFLRGTVDNGLLKTHKQVIAWKYDLSNVGKPEILALTKEKVWVKLQKPRKSYEEVCRTILITVHCLHFVRRNPDLSTKSLWDQLGRAFSFYEVKPSENDLVDHMGMIREALKRDDSMAKSKILLKFLEEKPRKRKLLDKDVQSTKLSGFIVDDLEADGIDNGAEEDKSDEEEELYDSVCAFCDNGGELLCCEGRCLRSFHATKEAGIESECESLGFTQEEVEAMPTFFCENCKHEQHQCFACGELSSSVKSSGAEVFCCANATCGHFYHPHCVAKLLHHGDEVAAEEHAKRIVAGEGFSCPIHKCCVCGLGEKKKDTEMQFAVCRRCPKSYHRKCLPREIVFENDIEEDSGTITKARAWEGLLLNHILIYCLDHEIGELGTPERDHIKFPVTEEKKISFEKKKKIHASALPMSTGKFGLKKKSGGLEDSIRGKSAMKEVKRLSSAVKEGQTTKTSDKVISGSNFLRKVKETGLSRKSLKESTKPISMQMESSVPEKSQPSLGDKLFAYMTQNPELVQTQKLDKSNSDLNKIAPVKSTTTKKISSEVPSLDADSERRIKTIMKEAASSVTLDEIMEKFKGPTTHTYSSRSAVDKTITVGKIEGSVEAVRTALQMLEKGSTIDDALAICEPEILQQIFKWQNKLKIYLAPFLHGMRYTSFGRHFTKEEKLQAIVDRLHWYVQDGDMIVDTSCGSNDFSLLMKAKLEDTRKKCSYRNYDIIQPKNDFNFEQRDWLTVQPKELAKGSQLIMGLNPPFGVKGALANQFIDKVLEFRPKLVILIVPPETERLDEKKSPYELIWEDNEFSSGKAFYLPGSVDENDKQLEQWNVTPPPLRLWSRKDWAAKHRAIAEKHGHVYRKPETCGGISDQQLDDHGRHDVGSDLQKLEPEECHGHSKDQYNETSRKRRHEEEKPARGVDGKSPRSEMYNGNPRNSSSNVMDDRSSRTSVDSVPSRSLETEERHGHLKKQFSKGSRKRRHGEEKHGRTTGRQSAVDGDSGRKPPTSELNNEVAHHSPLPAHAMDGRSSVESVPSKSLGMTTHTAGVGEHHYQHFEQTMPVSHKQAAINDIGGRYSRYSEPSPVGNQRMSADTNYREQFTGHMRGGADILGYARYSIEPERASNLLYGQPPVTSTRANYQAGYNPGYSQIGSLSSTYGHFGSLAESSYPVNTSTMQRYAPRLDELNPARIATLGPGPPMVNGNSFYPPRPPHPGYRDNSMGYPPGPYQSYPHNHSAGWLNE